MSLVSRLIKANPSIQVSDVLAGTFTLPSAKGVFDAIAGQRALFGPGGNRLNVIDYVNIATTGNATDFGDLTVTRTGLAACSNAHGGLAA